MFYIGLDLGQRRDHSAIVVVERASEVRLVACVSTSEAVLVRHAERVPLGTSYPRVVERVREIVSCDELAGRCVLVVDGTGVGAPVVEMLRGAQVGCEILSVTITGGERASRGYGAGGTVWNVPKQDLVAAVNVLLERGELRIAKEMVEAGALVRELRDMRAVPGRRGRVRMGADGYGEHDDLVVALALACWGSGRRRSGFGTRRLTGI